MKNTNLCIIAVVVTACSLLYANSDIHTQGRVTYCTPEQYAHPTLISFSNGISFDTRSGEPDLPEDLRIGAYEGIGYYLVQVTGPINDAWKHEIEAAGGEIAGYIPYYTLLVRADAMAMERIDDLPFVGWTGIFQPAYKMQQELFSAEGIGRVAVQISSLEDINVITNGMTQYGFTIKEKYDHPICKSIDIAGDLESIYKIASIPGVLWIQIPAPLVCCNSSVQWVVQTGWQSAIPGSEGWRVWNEGLLGDGIVLGCTDSGVNTDHDAFYDASCPITAPGLYPNHRKVVGYNLYEGASFGDHAYVQYVTPYHGTWNSGTILGDDSINGGSSLYDGVAIHARLFMLDLVDSSGHWSPETLTNFTPLWDSVYLGHGLPYRIQQNSLQMGKINVLGNYLLEDASTDAYTWQYKDFLQIFPAGNEGANMTILTLPIAKNVVASGGTCNGIHSNQLYNASSRGPTQDNRIKPNIVGPAFLVRSAYGATTNGYITYSGTCGASTSTNGALGLVRQYLLAGFYPSGSENPSDSIHYQSSALLRAMAFVSADPNVGSYVVPSYTIGWGRLDIDSVLYFTGDTRKLIIHDDTIGIGTGQALEDSFRVLSSIPLRICMAWTDTAAAPNANPTLVNDINLELIGPDGTSYRGNQYSGGQSIPNPGTWDNINVEECCRINAPQTGIWHVIVSGQQVVFGPQPYAYAITGNITPNTGVTEMPGSQLLPGDIWMTIEPNPFTMQCIVKIQYALSSKHYAEGANSTKTELNVYDVSGRVVKSFRLTPDALCATQITWSGTDQRDRPLPSGVYFVRLIAGEYQETRKVLLIR